MTGTEDGPRRFATDHEIKVGRLTDAMTIAVGQFRGLSSLLLAMHVDAGNPAHVRAAAGVLSDTANMAADVLETEAEIGAD